MSAHRLTPLFVLLAACNVPLSPRDDAGGRYRGEACEEAAILAMVNDPSVDAAALMDLGVYSRGAKNLVAVRDGGDGLPGTPDDDPFASLAEIDAVSQVGPSSMEALLSWGDGRCSVDVVFSPQSYDRSHLARSAAMIDAATRSVDVAIYSFSDAGIRDALERAVDRGLTVRVVYEGANEQSKSPAGTWSASLEDRGMEVRWVNKIMHHKFAVVDGPRTSVDEAADATLYSSSGNWSYSAGTKYDENSVFVAGDEKLVLQYQREFDRMWDNGRAVVWNEDLLPIASVPVTQEDVDAADGSEAVFTSANFRNYDSTRYGPTFSRDGSKATVVTRLVELIDGAQTSIRVASGHFRSRPIAEAIVRKAQEGLDVQVYLDQQEQVSGWTWNSEVGDYEDCLAEAVDAGDLEDCAEMGLHFGYLLVEAGVPVRFKTYGYRWDYSYAAQMHHKYLVVDGDTVATGSYNYSTNAEYDTFENVGIYTRDRYPALVDGFVANHAAMWETGRDGYDALVAEISGGAGDVPLVWSSMALTQDEIEALDDVIRDACPAADSTEYREDPAHHQTCPR